MSPNPGDDPRNCNLWAPWRTEYIDSLSTKEGECFLCRYGREPSHDRENLVLWRGPRTLTTLNRFPYTGGHCMVAPLAHAADLEDLDAPTLRELMERVRDVLAVLRQAVRAHGFNVGMNLGRCAGAGLPGHLHVHVVPRWEGDTNFMSVLGGTRVISQALQALYEQVLRTGTELKLPRLAP